MGNQCNYLLYLISVFKALSGILKLFVFTNELLTISEFASKNNFITATNSLRDCTPTIPCGLLRYGSSYLYFISLDFFRFSWLFF
jgi:hypothetical protein